MGAPSCQFLCLRNRGPGPLRSVSSHTIWDPSSGQFLCLLYVGAPLDNFLRLLYGGPLRSVFSLTWGPLRSIFLLTMWGPLQISFFAYYMGPLRSVSSLTIGGPLNSVFSHTIWGLPQINFFAYYMGAP